MGFDAAALVGGLDAWREAVEGSADGRLAKAADAVDERP
jgi:hypothetical protein